MTLTTVADSFAQSTDVSTGLDGEVAVCCGCRPRRRQWRSRRESKSVAALRSSQYFETRRATTNLNTEDSEKDSMFFFDAEQDPLADDEYPASSVKVVKSQPSTPPSSERKESAPQNHYPSRSTRSIASSVDFAGSIQPAKIVTFDEPGQKPGPISNHRRPSTRFHALAQQSLVEFERSLCEPPVKIPHPSYPGGLTDKELQECRKFLMGLEAMNPSIYEQVYSMRDVEEAPYTVCRWLRATKFDATKILERLASNQATFEKAREADFYPNVSETIGAPFSVFLSQYPYLPIGRSKEGYPVNYFLAGRINPEGILSMTTKDRIGGYFWWSFMHKFKQELRKTQADNPNLVRIEGINVMDLQGLSASALTSDTTDVIKLASMVSDFFPETLNRMLIINAPGFFAMFWGVIKKFIDPRTASRIKVYSNKEKAMAALREVADTSQIPTDYGGTNKSVKQAFVDEASDPLLIRQEVSLLNIKKKGGKASLVEGWKLGPNEYMEIRAYTRSVSSGSISVSLDGEVCSTAESKCSLNSLDPTGSPYPNCTVVGSNLVGPGLVNIEVRDLDNAEKRLKDGSRGYFLLVGDVKHEARPQDLGFSGSNHHPTHTVGSQTSFAECIVPVSDHIKTPEDFQTFVPLSLVDCERALREPRVKIPMKSYPGGLTDSELQECRKFLMGLEAMNPSIYEQVYSMRDVEEAPYTVCRWLRATKFDASKILERIAGNQSAFEKARDADFYPNVSETIGAPFSVYLSQYPYLPIGRSKEGYPVNYFLAGRINPEGILCMTTKERMAGYFWFSFMHKFKQELRKAQADNPNLVRIEGINVLDLQGLSASALSSDTTDVIKLASMVSDFFPETLNRMLIINAPGFFAMFWGVIKKFIDPRTASRIKVYSNKEKAMAALREVADISEIPTDYGGTNKSMKQAFVDEASDPLLIRQEVCLMNIKKKGGKAKNGDGWILGPNEYMEVRVFTRSASSASVSVSLNGVIYSRAESKSAHNVLDPTSPLPHCTMVESSLVGPGLVEIEAHDLDNVEKKLQNSPRGHFLVVGDVKRFAVSNQAL
eukprot:Nitzschia sp. Nitz4//NODE_202_length_38933_cov_72.610268//22338//25671//NITZ4_additional_000024-RA//-1//CDS//3329531792//2909//frame0